MGKDTAKLYRITQPVEEGTVELHRAMQPGGNEEKTAELYPTTRRVKKGEAELHGVTYPVGNGIPLDCTV